MPKITLHEYKTISEHNSYHGWPTIISLDNNELIVVCSAGRERHVCPFGQVHLLRSTDKGKTWSQPEVLINSPLDDRDAGILQTSKETILVNWFTSLAWLKRLKKAEKEGRDALEEMGDGFVSRCKKIRAIIKEKGINESTGPWIIRSEDGGNTFSNKIDCKVGNLHGPIELIYQFKHLAISKTIILKIKSVIYTEFLKKINRNFRISLIFSFYLL